LRDFPENPNLALYEGILLRELSTFRAVSCLALQVFPETPTIAL